MTDLPRCRHSCSRWCRVMFSKFETHRNIAHILFYHFFHIFQSGKLWNTGLCLQKLICCQGCSPVRFRWIGCFQSLAPSSSRPQSTSVSEWNEVCTALSCELICESCGPFWDGTVLWKSQKYVVWCNSFWQVQIKDEAIQRQGKSHLRFTRIRNTRHKFASRHSVVVHGHSLAVHRHEFATNKPHVCQKLDSLPLIYTISRTKACLRPPVVSFWCGRCTTFVGDFQRFGILWLSYMPKMVWRHQTDQPDIWSVVWFSKDQRTTSLKSSQQKGSEFPSLPAWDHCSRVEERSASLTSHACLQCFPLPNALLQIASRGFISNLSGYPLEDVEMTVSPSYESYEKQQMDIFCDEPSTCKYICQTRFAVVKQVAWCDVFGAMAANQCYTDKMKATPSNTLRRVLGSLPNEATTDRAVLSSYQLCFQCSTPMYSSTLLAACFSKATAGAPCTIHSTKEWLNNASQRMPWRTLSMMWTESAPPFRTHIQG